MTSAYDWKNQDKKSSATPIREMTITFAENGIEVKVRHEEPKRKANSKGEVIGPAIDWDSLNRKFVFTSKKEAAAFIASKLK
jgi:hypothetical protein